MFGAQILESARRQGDAVHACSLPWTASPRVTEVFGDEAGEDLLVAVADALRSATRASDVVARWDTDVFVVLGPGRGVGGAADRAPDRRRADGPHLPVGTGPPGDGRRLRCWRPGMPGHIDSLLQQADDSRGQAPVDAPAGRRPPAPGSGHGRRAADGPPRRGPGTRCGSLLRCELTPFSRGRAEVAQHDRLGRRPLPRAGVFSCRG